MTAEVYGRKYNLRVGRLTKLVADKPTGFLNFSDIPDVVTGGALSKSTSSVGYRDYVTIPPENVVIEVTDLHIETSVELGTNAKSSTSGAKIVLKIYNLSKESQRKINSEDSVILRAGYEQDEELPLIFASQIVTVQTRRIGSDIVTTLICGDSFTPRKNLRVSKTFPRKTTKREVIQYMLDQAAGYGVPTGAFFVPSTGEEASLASLVSEIQYNPAKGLANARVDEELPSGFTVFGFLIEELARVCDDIDFRSYLLHGSLYVEPIEYRIKQTTVSITGQTLIGSIRVEDSGATKLTGDSLKQRGITLEVPLNGRITTTSLINVSDIENEELTGSFAVSSMKHTLHLERGKWTTTLTCKRVS